MVELLVATTLGLLILVAVTNIFVGSRQSFKTQEGMSQIQETGRLLSYLMYPYIRLAGYLPNPIEQTDPSVTFPTTGRALSGTENDATDANVKNGSDTITVRYRGQDNAGTNDGAITTCLSAGGVSAADVVTTIFRVTEPTNGISNLECSVAINAETPTVQPVLQGVQDMQILYGVGAVDSSTLDRVTQRYYTANAVPDWTRVTSVRLTFFVDSIDKVAGNTTAAGSDGGRLRRTFTSTLQIRNRLN